MTIYHYHPETGEYVGSSEAKESPREPGVYLIPAYATEIAPPDTGEHEIAVFDGTEWSIVADYRGTTYYMSWDDKGTTIKELGVTPPEDSYDTRPEKPPLTYEEKVELVDEQRREAYRKRVDPLTAEYQVKMIEGKTEEAEELATLILTERETVKQDYPWPEEEDE